MKSGYDQFFIKAKENAGSATETAPRKHSNKFARNISERREQKQKNKKGFPVWPMFSFLVCGVIAFCLIEKFEDIEGYISKIEIGLGTAQAETKTEDKAKPVEPAVAAATEAPAAVTPKSDENTDYLFKLAERKKELDAREDELNKKSSEIAKQKTELEDKLKELEQYREKISTMLKERITSDSAKVDNLVQVYSNMKPSQAAKVFETMDEDLVIEILGRMKKKSAADILNIVKADKAQTFSERYAGYRAPASNKEASAKETTDENENKPSNGNEMKAKP